MPFSNECQAHFDSAVNDEVFSVPKLGVVLLDKVTDAQFLADYKAISAVASGKVDRWLLNALVRFAFLIELVKAPKIETTKFEVRWADRLSKHDPRFATFDECVGIFKTAFEQLKSALADQNNASLMQLFRSHSLVAYEIPVDYINRRRDRQSGALHASDNVKWLWTDKIRKTIELRRFLLEGEHDHRDVFELAYKKVCVKTYLTDRVLTGDHKTNREKRWETHPASVHYALRETCLEVENTLINQLCHFADFPPDLRAKLETAQMLAKLNTPFCCPITLDPLSFKDFEESVRNPEAGKSIFQVGHLNPLKAEEGDGASGHTAQNIAWISSDGNRIQGHLSLEDTRRLLKRTYQNYLTREIVKPK
jgi:hypothetical protein